MCVGVFCSEEAELFEVHKRCVFWSKSPVSEDDLESRWGVTSKVRAEFVSCTFDGEEGGVSEMRDLYILERTRSQSITSTWHNFCTEKSWIWI